MDNLFLKLFRTPETRQRIYRTLVLLIAYRLGFQIPIPGTDPDFLKSTADQGIMGMLSALSGGAIGQTTVFALGIMPYISASIIFSMLTKVSPALEAISKEGAAGQKRINQWTRLSVVPIALVQALLVYSGVFMQDGAKMVEVGMREHTVAMFFIVVTSLIAGSMIVMWIGELITEYGAGNGASLIIMAGIIAVMPSSFASIRSNPEFWQIIMFLCATWAVVILAVVFMHKGARRIPIQYARLTRGRRVYGGQRHYLPIKVNMAGVMPIIFASVLFVIPGVIFKWLGWGVMENIFSDQTGFIYVTIYLLLIFSFCFFWNRLMFQPEEIANNLREHGSFIPGIRPGQKTSDYLAAVLTRVTLVGAAFLAVVAVMPAFITKDSGMTQSMQYFVTGTSVLIVVGVALELMDKLQAQLVMKTYENEEGGAAEGQNQAKWAQGKKGSPSGGGAR
ncbi:MAG: preprotein translocase subunit SecY [bacterium]|nr:preprotein translocase subunit SecY [bacterium]